MSTRTGFIAGLTAAVAAATASLWVLNRDGGEVAEPSPDPGAAEVTVARPEDGAPPTADGKAVGDQRLDVLATPAPPQAPNPEAKGVEPPTPAKDSGLGGAPAQPTNTEQFAQEIASNLGWPALGPYEANQLGAEAAQFASAREAARTALTAGSSDPTPWTTLTRSAEALARNWMERFGRTRGAQLVDYLGVTAFDPATGEPQPLDLDRLAQSRRKR